VEVSTWSYCAHSIKMYQFTNFSWRMPILSPRKISTWRHRWGSQSVVHTIMNLFIFSIHIVIKIVPKIWILFFTLYWLHLLCIYKIYSPRFIRMCRWYAFYEILARLCSVAVCDSCKLVVNLKTNCGNIVVSCLNKYKSFGFTFYLINLCR